MADIIMTMPFLERLCENQVRFVVIGGQAVRHYGMPRFTMDWDLCIPDQDEENMQRLNKVLAEIDKIPVLPLGPRGENFVQTYQTPWGVVQFHLRPIGMPNFEELEKEAEIDDDGVKYACATHLLSAKMSVNRAVDQLDIEFLKRINKNEG